MRQVNSKSYKTILGRRMARVIPGTVVVAVVVVAAVAVVVDDNVVDSAVVVVVGKYDPVIINMIRSRWVCRI